MNTTGICTACTLHVDSKVNCVRGVGPAQTDLMFVGETLTEDDETANQPFAGTGGEIFSRLLYHAGINRDNVYVTHTSKCRPVDKQKFRRRQLSTNRFSIHYSNRKTTQQESYTCGTTYLDAEIKAVEPKVIISMGGDATDYLFEKFQWDGESIVLNEKGKPKLANKVPPMPDLLYNEFWSPKYNCYIVPIYNPTYIMRNVEVFVMMGEILKKAKRIAEFGIGTEVTNSFIALNFEDAMEIIKRASQHQDIAYDHETDGLDWRFGPLINTGLSWKEGTGATIRWIDIKGEPLFSPDQRKILTEALRTKVFQDKSKRVIGYHEAYDASWTEAHLGFKVTADRHDAQMLYHTLNTTATHNKQSLEKLAWLYTDMYAFKKETKPYFAKKMFVDCPVDVMSRRNCADVDATLRLFNRFYPKVMASPTAKHYDLLLKRLPVMATVLHRNGANVGLKRLSGMRDKLVEESEGLAAQFAEDVGAQEYLDARNIADDKKVKPFNIRSGDMLAIILFEKLKLPIIGRTPTGKPQITEYILEELYKKCPAIEYLMKYRKLIKLLGTYVLGLRGCALFGNSKKRKPDVWSVKDAIDAGYATDGRVHPSFSVVGTVTGRPSVSNPNIANQPRPTDQQRKLGVVLRQAFEAPKGQMILERDLSQAELRVLAAVSGDVALKEAVNSPEGVHRRTAAGFFGLPPEEAINITEEQKAPAKTIVFAITYGGTSYTVEEQIPDILNDELSRRLRKIKEQAGDSKEDIEEMLFSYEPSKEDRLALADEWIDAWRAQYPQAGAWIERQRALVRETGVVTTVFGRVFHFPLIFSKDRMVRSTCERAAINYAIQSPASDITFLAGDRIQIEIEKRGMKAKWINMVYDALFYEVPDEEVKELDALVKLEMERPVPGLDINIVSELELGRCWKEDKEERELAAAMSSDGKEKDRYDQSNDEEEDA